MKITGWLIGIALFSGVIIGLSGFSGSLFSSYGVPGAKNLSSLSRLNQMSVQANNTITNIKSQTGFISTVFTSVALLWGVITQIVTIPATFIDLLGAIDQAMSPYHIPGWFILMVATIIVITLAWKAAAIISGSGDNL